MADEKRAVESVEFKDRKTGLVLFGILQIIFGAFCALNLLLMIFSMIALKALGTGSVLPISFGQMILVVLLYLILAVWFIWMGIGSILARRWARGLILLFSWLWLITGVTGFILMLFIMPDMYGPMAMGRGIPQETVIVVQYIMTGFIAVIFVLIPGVFVLFYGSKHVKATCELRDPHVRWTDKRPLPVLALSSLFGAMALSMPFLAWYRWTVPFFGFIVSGITGALITFVYILLFAYVAWGTYQLRGTAWWCGVLLTIASAVSVGITFSRVSLMDFYERMNIPTYSLEIMREFGIFQDFTVLWVFWGIAFIGFLGFLLYTKKYFTASS